MNLFWLLFAHFIGDIALQQDWIAQNKGKYWYIMFAHCIIWSGCVALVLLLMGLLAPWKVIFLVIGHYLMDHWKANKPRSYSTWWYVYPDQAWHFIQIGIVYYL